jgi:RNA polymerase sigma factor (sigma-70 family)
MIAFDYRCQLIQSLINLAMLALGLRSAQASNASMETEWSMPEKVIGITVPAEGPQRDEAFLAMLKSNKGIIYSAARPFCRTWHEKKNLYDEVVVALWIAFPRFRNECKPTTWMNKIAFRTALLYWKKRQRLKLEYTDAIEQFADRDENAGARGRVDDLMMHLEPVDRAIATLILEQGCPRKEVGEILDLSENAVNCRVMRVKARFRTRTLEV